MLPDRSVLIGQKLVENAKIQKFKCDILRDFQTLWTSLLETSSDFPVGFFEFSGKIQAEICLWNANLQGSCQVVLVTVVNHHCVDARLLFF